MDIYFIIQKNFKSISSISKYETFLHITKIPKPYLSHEICNKIFEFQIKMIKFSYRKFAKSKVVTFLTANEK